jgi:hypothetical protein
MTRYKSLSEEDSVVPLSKFVSVSDVRGDSL